MKLRYGLNDRPPVAETAVYALQWLAVALPFIIIIGLVSAGDHLADPGFRTVYLQKATFVTGLLLLGQALFGHRLTLVAGPSAALLLGIVGSRTSPDAIYTSVAICGLILAFISAAGFFGVLRNLFTPRVITAVLLLIAFTMTPTIVRMLTTGSGGSVAERLVFAALYILALFVAHGLLTAAGRALLIIAGMAAGTAGFWVIFGIADYAGNLTLWKPFFTGLTTPVFDTGTIISFLFCFVALSLNEIGSMQALIPLMQPEGMDGRIKKGLIMAGGVNAAAGMLGVIGPVDYSLSPGVIAASGCGSRFPLLPAACFLLLASFSPAVLGLAGAIPPTVVGGILVYTLAWQIAAGLISAFSGRSFSFEDGLVIGLPILAGTVAALLPLEVVAEFPLFFRPLAGNGFVIGVVAVLILDRVFPRPSP